CLRGHRADGISGHAQHLGPTTGVHGEHADTELGGFGDGRCNGVRDVVILQVEKNALAASHQVTNDLWAFSRKELLSDLILQRRVAHRRHNLTCGDGGGDIQGNNQPLTRISHPWQYKGVYGSEATGRNEATVSFSTMSRRTR